MNVRSKNLLCVALAAVWAIHASQMVEAADAPSVKHALTFRPIQKHVEYESPTAAEQAKCRVKVERNGKASGWVVVGPNGQPLRRFVDTNGDNVVDLWKYYDNGLEVYRDIDSNFNNKVDQFRWLNTGGSRWGIDKNEDGRIDQWKVLSAEEASREVVHAMANRDQRALTAVLINRDDIRKLGIKEAYAKKLLDSVADPGKKLQKTLAGSKTLNAKTRWLRFDCSMPSTIPADKAVSDKDIAVYENAMTIVDTAGKTHLLQIGELVRIGDCWKLTQIPVPLEGNSVQVSLGGFLMQPSLIDDGSAAQAASVSPETQRLLKQLQDLDRNSPPLNAGTAKLGRYNSQRADLLEKLIDTATTDQERNQWLQQLADGVAAAVQTGSYPNGLKRLKGIEDDIRKRSPKSPLVPWVSYRRLLSEYSTKMRNATDNAGQQKVQEWWPTALEKFTKTHPKAEDTPDALLQLAIAHEFAGKTKDARRWYVALADEHQDSGAAARAKGAIRRLDLKGKPFEFSAANLKGGTVNAKQFRRKVLFVVFWATWSKGHSEDLPQLQALYKKYRGQGFEILGINLDDDPQAVRKYVSQHRISWPQVHQPGGMASEPAITFGIIAPSTNFLVGTDGKVVHQNVTVEELKTLVPQLLKK